VPEGLPEGVEALFMPLPVNIWRDMPDVDQMREVYKACVYLSRRPLHASSLEALEERIGDQALLGMNICHLSLLALMDMKLVSVSEKPLRMQLPPVKKTDPDSSAVWRRIQDIKIQKYSMSRGGFE